MEISWLHARKYGEKTPQKLIIYPAGVRVLHACDVVLNTLHMDGQGKAEQFWE